MTNLRTVEKFELFHYYVEQTRHTENLWIEISKFFTTLITAVITAIAFIIKFAQLKTIAILISIMSLSGFILSVFALGVVLSYQKLIREWVKKKEMLENKIYLGAEDGIRKLGQEEIISKRQLKTFILPFSAGIYIVFSLLFLAALFLGLFSPEIIQDLFVGTGPGIGMDT